jgi:signal transduction histidine kinase
MIAQNSTEFFSVPSTQGSWEIIRFKGLMRYLGAIGFALLAIYFRSVLDQLLGDASLYPYATFYLLIALSTWLFDLGPGFVTAALCEIFVAWALPPSDSLGVGSREDQINLASFTIESAAICLILAKLKATQRELRIAKNGAETANRSKDEFLEMVSHELRTPLNAIVLSNRLLAQDSGASEKMLRSVHVIERAAHTLANMVDDLVDSGRIVSGRLAINRTSVDLVEIIRAAADMMSPAAEERGVRLITKLAEPSIALWVDSDRIQQVISNLVSNAIKFTPGGGIIEVAARSVKGGAELRIRDTGEGIDPALLPHIFDRFAQDDGAPKGRCGGLGLGLFIVKALIELHGGTIVAMSAGKGCGTIFAVFIPTGADA